MKTSKFSARDLARVAMGVALIAVCSWLSVPMTVPFTLQTFAVCLLAALFGLRLGRKLSVLIAAMALGILLCYTFGTAWFVQVYTRSSGPITVGAALGMCVFPYLLPDAVKIALAAILTKRLAPILRKD